VLTQRVQRARDGVIPPRMLLRWFDGEVFWAFDGGLFGQNRCPTVNRSAVLNDHTATRRIDVGKGGGRLCSRSVAVSEEPTAILQPVYELAC